MTDRETGTVKWFNEARRFGFIARDTGTDVFVHISDIEGSELHTLHEGQRVELSVEQGPKGPRATHVRVLGPA